MFLFLKKINTASYLFYFLFFFLFTKNIFSWNEVSCSQLKELSYESNEFLSDKCMQNNNQGVMGEYIQLFNSNGEMLFITDEYLNSNSVWNSDFSYQFLKRDYVENRILSWGFGNSISSIDNKVEETFFLIVESKNLRIIREEIYKRFVSKGGNQKDFDPHWFFPHITIGFTKRDLHESDGILKNLKHSYDNRFILN